MLRRVVLALATVGMVSAMTAGASAAIRITKIQYDSPGSDTGSNSSLNAEYVVIKNTGGQTISLDGWVLKDVANHRYFFVDFRLRAGHSAVIHTGTGGNTRMHLYQDRGWYIWNNDGDTATLTDDDGDRRDTCAYSGDGTSVTC